MAHARVVAAAAKEAARRVAAAIVAVAQGHERVDGVDGATPRPRWVHATARSLPSKHWRHVVCQCAVLCLFAALRRRRASQHYVAALQATAVAAWKRRVYRRARLLVRHSVMRRRDADVAASPLCIDADVTATLTLMWAGRHRVLAVPLPHSAAGALARACARVAAP